MQTEVIMKREIFGKEISQKSKSEFFSATDLVKAGNTWRAINGLTPFSMNDWFNQKTTKEFIAQLEEKYGQVKISGRGRGVHTWVHPYLFIDMALAISPALKIEVYGWIFDHLLQYRNDSGDSYKKMAGALYTEYGNKREFPFYIANVADKIKKTCKVLTWETATQEQLKLRDRIHEAIYLLSDIVKVPDEIVRLAIIKATKEKE